MTLVVAEVLFTTLADDDIPRDMGILGFINVTLVPGKSDPLLVKEEESQVESDAEANSSGSSDSNFHNC